MHKTHDVVTEYGNKPGEKRIVCRKCTACDCHTSDKLEAECPGKKKPVLTLTG